MQALVNILVFTSDSDSTLEEEEAYLIFVIFYTGKIFGD